MLLLAALMVGEQQSQDSARRPVVDRLDAGRRIRPDSGGNRDRSRRNADSLRVALPFSVGTRDGENLFGVRPRPLPQLAREAIQPAFVLHAMQELGRTIRVGGNDHLLGGVPVSVSTDGALRPSRMARMHLEPASIKRREVVNLVQLMNLCAELLRQIQVVRRHLVLGVVAAADLALATGDTSGAPGPNAPEVRILDFDSWLSEVHANRRLVESLSSSHFCRDLLHIPIDVGRQVGITNDAEHSPCLVVTRRQFVGPVGDRRPFRRIEELFRRDVERVAVDVRTAADACAT